MIEAMLYFNNETITLQSETLENIYWYDEFGYPQGVEKAKERLVKDLEQFK